MYVVSVNLTQNLGKVKRRTKTMDSEMVTLCTLFCLKQNSHYNLYTVLDRNLQKGNWNFFFGGGGGGGVGNEQTCF